MTQSPKGEAGVLFSVRNLSKVFPGQRALDAVDLDIRAGEIHGLVGQNGSGKSTLIKILAGFHSPEPGAEAWFDGEPFQLGHAEASARAGLRFIHQDLGLIPTLSTVDNLELARGFGSKWWISLRAAARQAQALIRDFGFDFDVQAPIANLGAVERSVVAIIRALRDDDGSGPRMLVLDEPTESLAKPEVARLFAAVRSVAAQGAAVLYVSHRLDEVLELADEVTVLRDGHLIASERSAQLSHDALVQLIVGRSLAQLHPTEGKSGGETVLRSVDLAGGTVKDVSLAVRRGEIVGIAGLVGSGREELPYLLAGARPWVSGVLEIEGRAMTKLSPRAAARAGIFLVASDRAKLSAIQTFSAAENVTLPRMESRGPLKWLGLRREREEARGWMRRTAVDPPDPDRLMSTFSGGNQQKVVLARAIRCEPEVLVLDEPVQGVDIGARVEIFQQLLDSAAAGMSIVVASSEPEDLVTLCDRVLMMRNGKVEVELKKDELSSERLVEQSLASSVEVGK
jgi:ribose transport system ATP-binding protein